MIKVKEPSVANIFYSGNKEELENQLKSFSDNANNYEYQTRAVIVPHAGLVYSGQVAFNGINQLDKNIKNIFIFAPAHRARFSGLALTTYDEWKTPLGNIKINQEENLKIRELFKAKFLDDAYKDEHSVEIQIPIIQTLFQDVQIIPVLIGDEVPLKVVEILKKYYCIKSCGFIISSDLSHFLTDENARKIDLKTAQMIETGNIKGFSYEQACGAVGIYGLVNFANIMGYSLIRLDMMNSSNTTGDTNRVVGYGSWILYEGNKNKFIKRFYSPYLLDLVKNVILSKLDNFKMMTNHTNVFNELGACFVTLKKQGTLRGCIGSIIAHQPLISDIVQHALDSAFNDPRFHPLEKSEIDDLEIDISLLSEPKQIHFKSEEELLNKIIPNKDGVIIKDKGHQAVYLPSVWQDLPNKKVFLNSLKMKAGLSANHFSDTFEAYKFEAEYIS
ncbi:MAG: AmmeMemoRadiSam system protein B [Candidatus Gastranaerophilales bacterium]|nr:AmmeMemoRadiSam system protein B [Candidatus Gastranaerophilales bacterium]